MCKYLVKALAAKEFRKKTNEFWRMIDFIAKRWKWRSYCNELRLQGLRAFFAHEVEAMKAHCLKNIKSKKYKALNIGLH